jgi:hypothetical protein
MAVPGKTPTSPFVIVIPAAKVTAVRAWTAKFPHTVVLAIVVGAIVVVGALLGAELGLDEVVGVELGTDSKVTALWAMAQPFNLEPVPNVMAVPARMEPSRTLLAPRVAAVPRTQMIFFGLAPFSRMKEVPAAVTKVVPTMKTNLESGLPCPFKVTTVPTAKLMELPKR